MEQDCLHDYIGQTVIYRTTVMLQPQAACAHKGAHYRRADSSWHWHVMLETVCCIRFATLQEMAISALSAYSVIGTRRYCKGLDN